MSVERIAMEAAIEHAQQLERRIKELEAGIEEQYRRNNELERQLRQVRVAVHDAQNCPPPMREPSMPQGMESRHNDPANFTKTDCPRCKKCGAPV